jgi:hypothetical protein
VFAAVPTEFWCENVLEGRHSEWVGGGDQSHAHTCVWITIKHARLPPSPHSMPIFHVCTELVQIHSYEASRGSTGMKCNALKIGEFCTVGCKLVNVTIVYLCNNSELKNMPSHDWDKWK